MLLYTTKITPISETTKLPTGCETRNFEYKNYISQKFIIIKQNYIILNRKG